MESHFTLLLWFSPAPVHAEQDGVSGKFEALVQSPDQTHTALSEVIRAGQ
jgi:hypothetical protein